MNHCIQAKQRREKPCPKLELCRLLSGLLRLGINLQLSFGQVIWSADKYYLGRSYTKAPNTMGGLGLEEADLENL